MSVCLKTVAYGYETHYPCTQPTGHAGECTYKKKTKAELEKEEEDDDRTRSDIEAGR